MDHKLRRKFYREIERERETRIVTFVTSDRPGMETQIAKDCIDIFVDLLDRIGPTKKISFLLHTDGGDTLAAWRIVNLIRTFCDELEVLIPLKAFSAGTLISIGADRLVMTKQAALGPIDPSINNPLNPVATIGGQQKQVPVSVESVRGYLDAARDELGIKSESGLTTLLVDLANKIHPLVLGTIFRSRTQIRFLASKLIKKQVSDSEKIKSIIDFLCADSGSHDYTINRREATELGLNVEKPSQKLYEILRKIHLSYSEELRLLEPFSPSTLLQGAQPNAPVNYTEHRALVESTDGGCYVFCSEGRLTSIQIHTPAGPQDGIKDDRQFEGWRKLV